jgi:hypothetical protein
VLFLFVLIPKTPPSSVDGGGFFVSDYLDPALCLESFRELLDLILSRRYFFITPAFLLEIIK